MTSRSLAPLGLGVAGLGRGFMLTLPSLLADDRIRLVAAAAPRAESRQAFEATFGARSYSTVDALCGDGSVEAVYIATPHPLHAEHAATAARHGKHILVEKPIATDLSDAVEMVRNAHSAGVQLIVGPSHSFDAPVLLARQVIDRGTLGRVRIVQSFNYTDFLYRPRRAEELDTAKGGGVVFSQAVHQIDVARMLVADAATSVFAMTGDWDPSRPTEGAYSALIGFRDGAFAALTYSGYGGFDSDEWMGWINELGDPKNPAAGSAGKRSAPLADRRAEADAKRQRTFGAAPIPEAAPGHEQFGPVIVSCEHGAVRLTPEGVWVHGSAGREFKAAPAARAPRATVIDALWAAIRGGKPPMQNGEWGVASLEICFAILEAARSGRPVTRRHQKGIGGTDRKGAMR